MKRTNPRLQWRRPMINGNFFLMLYYTNALGTVRGSCPEEPWDRKWWPIPGPPRNRRPKA